MADKPCPKLEANNEKCPCTADDCPRHGTCCECIRAHVSDGSLPACCREVASGK